jgi:hypothetical protein
MFTVYADDSGTNNHARIVSGACCVASVNDWKKFERAWLAIGKEAGFKYFHMTEFAGCRPDKWCRDCRNGKQTVENHPWRVWSKQKRKKVLKKLAETVSRYATYGFGVALTKKDYETLVLDAPLGEMVEDVVAQDRHYTFTIQICAGALAKWRDRERIHKPMKYVFDVTDDLAQRHQIGQLFAHSVSGIGAPINDGMVPDGYAFESRKNLVQLLSADMLAWFAAKRRAHDVFNVPLSVEAQIIKRVVAESDKRLFIGKLTTDNFQDFAKRETEYRIDKKSAAVKAPE